ncbi:MAG: HlyD family efflux transporter periplasmic adaptor subunit [Verrucomicrobia bacterium]|nr:HlyD family efflux transporter periplasmic adaptor subunit [Verrucomicrobiota bacterium]
MDAPNPPPPEPKKKHKRALWIATIIFVLCGLLFLIYWLVWARFHKSTNDSYVNGNLIILTPQVQGIVVSILADNAQMVEEGQPLLEIDRHDFEIALDSAKSGLANAVRQVTQMFFRVEQLEAKKEQYEADLLRAQLDFDHRSALVADASVSREEYEHSETTLLSALSSLLEVEKELAGAKALIENTTVPTHPTVEYAKAALRSAFLSLHRCTLLAPARGIISQRRAQVGQWVQANDPMMALVPLDQIWVDANFREVDLRNFRVGQPVKLFADMYGRRTKFHGKVVGLNPGTGSVFSILPPQNATGNWIKIVQRVPVKISLDPKEIEKRPLVLGLSMTANVDIHDRSGPRLPGAIASKPIYKTGVYANELAGAESLIEQIVNDNSSPIVYDPMRCRLDCSELNYLYRAQLGLPLFDRHTYTPFDPNKKEIVDEAPGSLDEFSPTVKINRQR